MRPTKKKMGTTFIGRVRNPKPPLAPRPSKEDLHYSMYGHRYSPLPRRSSVEYKKAAYVAKMYMKKHGFPDVSGSIYNIYVEGKKEWIQGKYNAYHSLCDYSYEQRVRWMVFDKVHVKKLSVEKLAEEYIRLHLIAELLYPANSYRRKCLISYHFHLLKRYPKLKPISKNSSGQPVERKWRTPTEQTHTAFFKLMPKFDARALLRKEPELIPQLLDRFRRIYVIPNRKGPRKLGHLKHRPERNYCYSFHEPTLTMQWIDKRTGERVPMYKIRAAGLA